MVVVGVGARLWRKKPAVTVKAVPLSSDPADQGQPQISEKFVLLTQPQLVDVRGDQADRLRIRHSSGAHDFALYFVEALGGPTAEAGLVQDQAGWFGCEPAEIRSVGQDAALYVAQLLRGHRIEVLTRWEPVPQLKGCFYALVFVKTAQGSVNLGEQLIRQGFARIGGRMNELPGDPRELPDYLADLRIFNDKARSARLGIWSKALQRPGSP